MIEQSYAAGLHEFRRAVLDAARGIKLTQMKAGYPHEQIIPWATFAPWRNDAEFMEVYEKVKANTLVDIYRCYELWDLCIQAKDISGDILEVGVWRGGTAAVIGRAAGRGTCANLWLADTFEGVAKAGENDTLYKGGEHADTSEEAVRELLAALRVSNVRILRGIFPDDTATQMGGARIKFCHIDVDTYNSARHVFAWVWPRLVKGGAVVFDDYGSRGCEGVALLVKELKVQGHRVIYNLNGHALMFKD